MATGDKLVSLDDLKAVNDHTEEEIDDLKSALDDEANINLFALTVASDNWTMGGLYANTGEVPSPNINNKRISVRTPVFIRGVKSFAWSCESGYTARCVICDKDGLVRSMTNYTQTGSYDFASNAYYIWFTLYHGDADMTTSESNKISITFKYDSFRNFGQVSSLGYTALSSCKEQGYYGFPTSYVSTLTDLPSDWIGTGGTVLVFNNTFNGTSLIQLLFSGGVGETKNVIWERMITTSQAYPWNRINPDISNYSTWHGRINTSVIDNMTDFVGKGSGWYGFGAADVPNIAGFPADYTGKAGYIEVMTPNYNGDYVGLILHDIDGNSWRELITISTATVYRPWVRITAPTIELNYNAWAGKNVAIIGDSISTNGTDGDYPNVPEITVTSADVGVELSAYLTYYDVQGGLSLGGHTFTESEIGTEVTFIPVLADVGKKIGVPNNYNPASTTVWWEVAKSALGFNPIPVCWSGSSVTSHEASDITRKTAHAWHDAQIRKCGIRTPGSMTRTAPDVIIIYRGTNDMTHEPYTLLTDGYFNNYNWEYPANDAVTGGYGYKEGLCLTIKKLRNTYPNAKIILCTLNVFKRVNYSHFPTNNGINSLPQYNDAIREVADFMGCGVIEFDKDGITFENCYSQGYITDSSTIPTHPSDKGHKAMGLKAIVDLVAQYSPME